MRLGNVLMIILTGLVTQSCKIESPFFVNIIKNQKLVKDDHLSIKSRSFASAFRIRNSVALKMQNGFKDTLIIGDENDGHGSTMRNVMHHGVGIPLENLVFFEDFGYISDTEGNPGLRLLASGEHEILRNATRVVHIPKFIPFETPHDAPRIQKNTILFVRSASNMRISFRGDRDLYNINHVVWNDRNLGVFHTPRENYKDVLEVHDTGKVIAATSAVMTDAGIIKPDKEVVSCGDIKESCFTIVPTVYTSSASAHLAAISFYLAQFWETPEEIVDVLKSCAVDVGEPGVDREYGQGVVNLWCPRVLKKEVEMVSQYLEDAGEKGEVLQGGEIQGKWRAENTALEVYIPKALKETAQVEYQGGTVHGAIKFERGIATADFTVKGMVRAGFLMLKLKPIEATAEEVLQFEEGYTVDQENLVAGEQSFHYTATEDSLHLVKSFSLNEILSLLPDPLGSMVDMASPDFFVNDPIQLRMSFSKEKPSLPGDFNEDGTVDVADFLIFVDAFGSVRGEAQFDEILDIVPDGIINIADFLLFVDQFGKTSDG